MASVTKQSTLSKHAQLIKSAEPLLDKIVSLQEALQTNDAVDKLQDIVPVLGSGYVAFETFRAAEKVLDLVNKLTEALEELGNVGFSLMSETRQREAGTYDEKEGALKDKEREEHERQEFLQNKADESCAQSYRMQDKDPYREERDVDLDMKAMFKLSSMGFEYYETGHFSGQFGVVADGGPVMVVCDEEGLVVYVDGTDETPLEASERFAKEHNLPIRNKRYYQEKIHRRWAGPASDETK
jgi:hypothetical protein